MFLPPLLLVICLLSSTPTESVDPELEEELVVAFNFLKYMNQKSIERRKKLSVAYWNYASNITDENLKIKIDVSRDVAEDLKEDWEQVSQFNWQTYNDPTMKRQFKFHSVLGLAALPDRKLERFNKITSEMQKVYSTAKVCEFNNATNCDLSLDEDLTNIFATSRNPDELKHYWVEWRKATGPKVKDMFEDYVKLANEAARLNNFTDHGDYWLNDFETPDFKEQIEALWQQIKPLYLQLHAYIRYQLHKKYGEIIQESGLIPAHLLGNIWAQSWNHLADFTLPFPGKQQADVTQEMLNQDYTPLKMFQLANEFFVSLNLTEMPENFWNNSILEHPHDGRELVCQATAMDFFEGDVRIRQCTQINDQDLYTAHHEMGHVEYFLQYRNQPAVFRQGANSGFQEAVGDTIGLSVSTAKHLKKIGLLNVTSLDYEVLLNNLYTVGLSKIVFLPYAYLMDLWRWEVFAKDIDKNQWNCRWWELREEYQGIEASEERPEDAFDPAAKYHVVSDVPYIRYFVSFVVQFQFHRALCIKAGEYDPDDPSKPLHECDIYQSKEAGDVLGEMLQLGSSKPWSEAMEVITGQRTMDASGLLEYFKPLQIWLEQENERNNVSIGWDITNKHCKDIGSKDGENSDSDNRDTPRQ